MIKASADFDLSKKDVPYSESIFYLFHTHCVQIRAGSYVDIPGISSTELLIEEVTLKHLNIRPPVSNLK